MDLQSILKEENINNRSSVSQAEILQKSLELVENSAIAMVGSLGPAGYPQIKAMFKMEVEGLQTIWFGTNTSSKRVRQFMADPRAAVYFVDEKEFKGLMLVGDMAVLNDPQNKQRLWRGGFEVYYPLGVTDPDYSVLRFTTRWGNYYHGLQNLTFEI